MKESLCYKKVNKILSDRSLPKHQKIELLKLFLLEINTIDLNTVKLIDLDLTGTYGIEYLDIQADYQIIIEFYQFLQQTFPEVYEVSLSLANLLLMNHHYEDSLNIFNQAFFEKPSLIFAAPGELLDILENYGSDEQKISYYFSLVRAFVQDHNLKDALELYQEIMQRYGANNKYVIDYLERSNLSSILGTAT